ncbi:uncharacterized protein Pyn_20939 [Prunus yedoensis var. nudiflora]|uniref:Uncharacterized protein n=1 Tax=Prunus yedoensis var. nudiflora TaxID=2094558 RepID=A0A314U9X3_PRUYE|nr:uncharacterized protein Pyn_20939 [Prunus yedoensis var. nudiflora]
MASVQSEIREGFAPSSISSNTGPDTIHLSPMQSHKNNKSLGPTEASIQERFATNRISSGSDSRAGHVGPEVSDSAPAESTPGTSGKSHSMFAVMKKITKFFKL